MEFLYQKHLKSLKKVPLQRITISLSPQQEYYKRINQLPKCFTPKSRSNSQLRRVSTKKNQTYSIAYIGEKFGTFTISSKKKLMPRISKSQISKEMRLRNESPSFLNNSNIQHAINNYFRPKPLTPASFKMHKLMKDKSKLNSKIILMHEKILKSFSKAKYDHDRKTTYLN